MGEGSGANRKRAPPAGGVARYVYFMNGTQIASEGYLRTVADTAWKVVGIGDFDQDGKDDIHWRNVSTGNTYIYLMDGLAIKPTEGYVRTVSDQAWQVAGVGDADGGCTTIQR
jgi:hypothetical protein